MSISILDSFLVVLREEKTLKSIKGKMRGYCEEAENNEKHRYGVLL